MPLPTPMPFGQAGNANPIFRFYQFLGSGAAKTADFLWFNDSGVCIGAKTLTIGATPALADQGYIAAEAGAPAPTLFSSLWTTTGGAVAVQLDRAVIGALCIRSDASIFALASDETPAVVVSSTNKEATLAAGTCLGVVPDWARQYGAALSSRPGFAVSPTTFTVGTAAYVAGDSIGGILSFANITDVAGRQIVIDQVMITDKSNQSIPMSILFFKVTPSGGTYTDGSPLVLAAADAEIGNQIGSCKIAALDYEPYPSVTPTMCMTTRPNLGIVLTPTSTTLYALIQADVGVSTTLTAGDLNITLLGRRL